MHIGVPKEIKDNEFRVAMTPAGAHELVRQGHRVSIEKSAGRGAGFHDTDYVAQGAEIAETASEAWSAEMVLKVKEPLESEYSLLRRDLILFTYLHLAANRPLVDAILGSGVTALAYETVQLANRSLPLLTPMSEVAGRLAPQVGAAQLLASAGGGGMLLGGVPGTPKARVVIIGGGVAGEHAALVSHGMGADVTILDVSVPRLRVLDTQFRGEVRTLVSGNYEVSRLLTTADLVIGAVLVPGASAPKVVTDEMVKNMKHGSVLVDIAIDQGGCFEGSHPTTHSDPTFKVHDAIFYCVANMPGAVPATSTPALTNVTLPYILSIAGNGLDRALRADEALLRGLNADSGVLHNHGVGAAHGIKTADWK